MHLNTMQFKVQKTSCKLQDTNEVTMFYDYDPVELMMKNVSLDVVSFLDYFLCRHFSLIMIDYASMIDFF